MHTDHVQNVAKRHDGQLPASWLTGGTDYQKATVIAAVAHHDIKDPSDPDFMHADLTYRENCVGIVESLMRGNMPDSGKFSQAAYKRWLEVSEERTDIAVVE